MRRKLNCTFKFIIFIIALNFAMNASAQTTDSLKQETGIFTGAVTVTTKGLSTFPNLTLGKPAAILDLSMGGKKLRFEPVLRFSLEGKPWSFIFWCRYELLNNEKFQFKIGAHPAYAFKTVTVNHNGTTKDILRAQQFLAGELAPVFKVGKNISLGPYYIYAHGMEKDIVQSSNFISFRANFSNINLSDNYFMRLMAQAYYLKLDANDGFYVNSTLSMNRRNFPFSVSSSMNKAIQSEIAGDNFLWNINLSYSFNTRYTKL
ncbi:MAG: hypothetical protein Q8S54_02590 [Bacteroidota bacterium]|nr:hypothetical protein [Odoribacter sp.]MDP3642060.1 hypothetical protein [Bacteroidota bacterium]